jgi:hypothetical protein
MSLKAFHILFIALSILMSALVGAWGIERYLQDGSTAGLALAAIFFFSGLALVGYGVRFWRKVREIT